MKRNEFISLVQGNKIVAKYEEQFTDLANYALTFTVDETNKYNCLKKACRLRLKHRSWPVWLDPTFLNWLKLL